MEKHNDYTSVFIKYDGSILPVKARIGDTVLETAHRNDIPLEGACEGSLACSTCHVILDASIYSPSKVSDRENDLLDMAFGVQPTSRLGCQVVISNDMAGKIFEIPRCTRNLAVDGYKPKPH